MANMPLLTEPGVACAVDIVFKAVMPACTKYEGVLDPDVGRFKLWTGAESNLRHSRAVVSVHIHTVLFFVS